MRARHKPDEVDAILWLDNDDTRQALTDAGYTTDNGSFAYANPTAPAGLRMLTVPTSEGNRVALPGESVIIHQADSGWYPIPLTVYEARYDTLDEVPS